MEYMISTPKRDAAKAAKARRARNLARAYGVALVFVLVACVLAASYGDMLAGINPAA